MTLAKCAAWFPLVEQGVEPTPAAAHLGRIGQAGGNDHRRHPLPILPEARHRAVTKPFSYFSLPGQQIRGEVAPRYWMPSRRKALDPILQRPGEGHGVELAGHVTARCSAGCGAGAASPWPLSAPPDSGGGASVAMKSSRMANSCSGLICSFCAPCNPEVVAIAHGTGKAVARDDWPDSRSTTHCSRVWNMASALWRTASSRWRPAPCWRRATAGHLAASARPARFSNLCDGRRDPPRRPPARPSGRRHWDLR